MTPLSQFRVVGFDSPSLNPATQIPSRSDTARKAIVTFIQAKARAANIAERLNAAKDEMTATKLMALHGKILDRKISAEFWAVVALEALGLVAGEGGVRLGGCVYAIARGLEDHRPSLVVIEISAVAELA